MHKFILGDAWYGLSTIEAKSVQACVTSPPYWGLRNYTEEEAEIGKGDLHEYLEDLVSVFSMLRAVLKDDGLIFLNLGDTAVGSGGAGGDYNKGGKKDGRPKYKQGRATTNVGILPPGQWADVPHRAVQLLQEDGWLLRKEIIWSKGVPRPESLKHVRRPYLTFEPIFMLAKTKSYYWDHDVYGYDTGRPVDPSFYRDVWDIPPSKGKKGHQAPWPSELVQRCILLSTREDDVVLDPFVGSGTTIEVAHSLNRQAIGIDIDEQNAKLASQNIFIEVEGL